MSRRKAQSMGLDLMLAIFVFTVLITSVYITWNRHILRLDEKVLSDDMANIAFQMADILVKSPGFPANWSDDAESAIMIGLAEDERVISKPKMSALAALSAADYKASRSILGVGPYDYYILLKGVDGNTIMSAGKPPTGNYIVIVHRYVMYDSKKADFEFVIWE